MATQVGTNLMFGIGQQWLDQGMDKATWRHLVAAGNSLPSVVAGHSLPSHQIAGQRKQRKHTHSLKGCGEIGAMAMKSQKQIGVGLKTTAIIGVHDATSC